MSPISQNARSLPLYAFYSVMRIGIAYFLSLVFAIGYGYIAARNPRVEAWMIAVLDILQSIPVLSFLPAVCWPWCAHSQRQLGDRAGRDPADLHRAGVEPRVQLLFVDEGDSARDDAKHRGFTATPGGSDSGSLKCRTRRSVWCGTRSSRSPAAGLH